MSTHPRTSDRGAAARKRSSAAEPAGADAAVTAGTVRAVPAPGLRETADIWFDTGADPVVTWDPTGVRFLLQDGSGSGEELELLRCEHPVADPERIATILAHGLAACDFPPTASAASPRHVAAALRAAGLDPDEL